MKERGRVSVALFEPEIAGNAGAVARMCAATGSPLHLIGRLGFQLRGPAARRAGMDYWERVELHRHATWDDFSAATSCPRRWLFTTTTDRLLWEVAFEPGDVLVFGSESRGLGPHLLGRHPERTVRIPMAEGERSLNLAMAAAVATYEAARQLSLR